MACSLPDSIIRAQMLRYRVYIHACPDRDLSFPLPLELPGVGAVGPLGGAFGGVVGAAGLGGTAEAAVAASAALAAALLDFCLTFLCRFATTFVSKRWKLRASFF